MKHLIERKVLISMIFIGLSIMGIFSLKYIPMELYPNAEFPAITVNISLKNPAEPGYIKNQAVIPVEGLISSLEGVEEIATNIYTRGARINISFSQNTDIGYTFLQLEQKIKNLTNIDDDFTIRVNKTSGGKATNQFMTLKILGKADINYIRNVTDEYITTPLESIEGVSQVITYGGRPKMIELIIDRDRCEALKITPARISGIISSNMAKKSFAGTVYTNVKEYFVNVTAEYLNINDLGDIVVAPGPTQLKDIAEIRFGEKEEESYSRVNGKEVITCMVFNSPMVNIIELSDKMRAEIKKLNREIRAKGVQISIGNDSSDVMRNNLNTIISLGLSGALLAIFILFIFLRNIKIVSFVALAIPISILSAFYFFYFYGISINTLTLTGIALAVGMLLDNSVVVMENIFRMRSNGYTPLEAAQKGTVEVRKSVIASTATTITVFLPFLFADDYILRLIGEHVGISIVSTLLVSLAVALLLIPMAVRAFMERENTAVNFSTLAPRSRAVQIYIAILKIAIRRPIIVISSAILLLIVSATLSFSLTVNTLKEIELNSFNLYMTFNSGNTLDKSDEMVRIMEERLANIPEIEEYSSKVFATDAHIRIKLKNKFEKIGGNDIAMLKDIVMNKTEGIAFADVSLEAIETSENFEGKGSLLSGTDKLLSSMGVGSQSEKVIIRGQDYESMMHYGEYLRYQLASLENISNTNINTAKWRSIIQLDLDQYNMEMYGVKKNNISNELRNFSPNTKTELTYKTSDNNEYSIIIKDKDYDEAVKEDSKHKEVRTYDELKTMDITTDEDAVVKLEQVSGFNRTWEKSSIIRINQAEKINLTYRFKPDINKSKVLLQEARDEVDELIRNSEVPTGVSIEIEHENKDNNNDFVFLILAAFAIIYMILASVFESLTIPIVLMFSIPLAAIGSFIILLLTGNSVMNSNVMIGFIILIGIVVNNSIILIDFTKQLRSAGYRKGRAIIMAGCSRLRPILITAITTIMAMLPLAMGKGGFVAGLGAPFAITVIGGLTMSTILTLVIVPTMYSGMEEALKRIREQRLSMKIIQISLVALSYVIIYLSSDTMVISICYAIATTIIIPLVTWFFEDSLKNANSNVIPQDKEIHISIENLVKIYGQPGEIYNEWHSGQKIRRRLGLIDNYRTLKDLRILIWMTPLVIFMVYFSYIYQTKEFWILFYSFFTWIALRELINIVYKYFLNNDKKIAAKITGITFYIFLWIIPLFSGTITYIKTGNTSLSALFITIWYFMILTRFATKYVQRKEKDKSTVRTKNKSRFYRYLQVLIRYISRIPILGVKKKPFRALNSINMEVHTGMFGLLGPNGAGKTTLMRIICGIFEQSHGKIFINGLDTQKRREELQGLIGYLPQEFGMYENMSAWNYLEYMALLKGIYDKDTRNRRVRDVLEAVHMYENRNKKIGGFSGGMKQRIGIAQTLLHLPRILVVDEPTAGLDPRERIRFRNLLVELSKNRIVIFSTHIIEDIASSCNQVGVISKGSLKYYGTPAEMAHIADKVCWTFEISAEEFAKLPKSLLIVHHIKNDNMVRVRCLSENKPAPEAVQTAPVLEDSYLWLLRNVKIKNHEEIITGSGLKR